MTNDTGHYVPPFRSEKKSTEEMRELIERHYPYLDDDRDGAKWRNHTRLLTTMALHEGFKWANNVGGLKRIAGHDWTSLGTHEVLAASVADALIADGWATAERHPHVAPPGKRAVYFLPGPTAHSATHFAAFGTLEEGVRVWLGRMTVRYMSDAARKALDECDPHALAAALKQRWYFSACHRAYGDALAAHLKSVPPRPATYQEAMLARLVKG